ncbi:MAG TPA: NAD(P)H-hydrate dehydratase [Candidatus Saccharimonadales bacterium]|nr:NAD(P)H-hydrate dehydratase [Candidatus Saccharimonadales bacterium]
MDQNLVRLLKPLFARPKQSHKYNYGHVLVIGGSPGMVGAPYLTARATLRIGAGLVTIASNSSVVDKLERDVEEIMTLRLPADNKHAMDLVADFIFKHKVNTLAIGPGLSKSKHELVKLVLNNTGLPTVLDGGGLAAFDNNIKALKNITASNSSIVLTPHEGEFAKLLGQKLPKHDSEIKEVLYRSAEVSEAIIVLKGNHTMVAKVNEENYLNSSGNPGLATAGSGDVLSGVIAGLLAQQIKAFEAAKGGVFIHGLAGDLAAQAKTQPGMIASDVIDYLPEALKRIELA